MEKQYVEQPGMLQVPSGLFQVAALQIADSWEIKPILYINICKKGCCFNAIEIIFYL